MFLSIEQKAIEQKKNLKKFLEDNAYGKLAFDSNLFDATYTEILTFSELVFVEINGTLETDITQTPSYQQYYSPGASNHDITEIELVHLAITVGIQFDPKTNFHGKLVISDSHSIQILRNAGIIEAKDMSSQAAASDSSALSSMKVAVSSTFFSPSISSGSLENLIINFNENPQLAAENHELLNSFYTLRELLNAKFYVKAIGEWSPLSPNIVTIKLRNFPALSKEEQEASRFLNAIAGSFETRNAPTGRVVTYTFDLHQCEAVIAALDLLNDKSLESMAEIDNRPKPRC